MNTPIPIILEDSSGNIELEDGSGPIILEGGQIISGYPNVVGLLLWEALQVLQAAGAIVPAAIGYFGTYPVSVKWIRGAPPGLVAAQSITPGWTIVANAPITLTVNEFPFSVAFP